MITENLSTLKIHKLSQAQYDREKEAGNLDETALYLTPDTEVDLSQYATKTELNSIPNLHTWKRYSSDPNAVVETNVTNQDIAYSLDLGDLGYTAFSVKYADSVKLTDGYIVLVEPASTLTVSYYDATSSNFEVLCGKYIIGGNILGQGFYYIPTNATFTVSGTSVKVNSAKKISKPIPYDCIGSTSSNTYPTSGQHSDGYWYEYNNKLGHHTHNEYATTKHTHDEYAPLDHTHDNMVELFNINSSGVTKTLSMDSYDDGVYMISTSCAYNQFTDNISPFAIVKKHTIGASTKYLNVLYTSQSSDSTPVPLVKVTSNTELTITHITTSAGFYHINKL